MCEIKVHKKNSIREKQQQQKREEEKCNSRYVKRNPKKIKKNFNFKTSECCQSTLQL